MTSRINVSDKGLHKGFLDQRSSVEARSERWRSGKRILHGLATRRMGALFPSLLAPGHRIRSCKLGEGFPQQNCVSTITRCWFYVSTLESILGWLGGQAAARRFGCLKEEVMDGTGGVQANS